MPSLPLKYSDMKHQQINSLTDGMYQQNNQYNAAPFIVSSARNLPEPARHISQMPPSKLVEFIKLGAYEQCRQLQSKHGFDNSFSYHSWIPHFRDTVNERPCPGFIVPGQAPIANMRELLLYQPFTTPMRALEPSTAGVVVVSNVSVPFT